ncbi:MAG: PAS domain S-box protein, partial [Vulcanimicrobiota bacterium]
MESEKNKDFKFIVLSIIFAFTFWLIDAFVVFKSTTGISFLQAFFPIDTLILLKRGIITLIFITMGVLADRFLGESKQERSKLLEKFTRQEEILDSMPEQLWIMNENFKIIFANREFCKWWGYRKEEVAGRLLQDIFTLPDYEKFIETTREIKEKQCELTL